MVSGVAFGSARGAETDRGPLADTPLNANFTCMYVTFGVSENVVALSTWKEKM